MNQKLDILAFGAHPDDVELGCAGTLLKQIALGSKVGIVDLTRGEMGTRGTPELRDVEAREAAKVMGIEIRENLGMKDGIIANDFEHQLTVIETIRRHKPRIVITNAPEDRHPDHRKGCELVCDAAYLSGLRKIETKEEDGSDQQNWRPQLVISYIQALRLQPNFVYDISDYWEEKTAAIRTHTSQFYNPASREPETFISSQSFLQFIESRARDFGNLIGVEYAEGFVSYRPIGVVDLDGIC